MFKLTLQQKMSIILSVLLVNSLEFCKCKPMLMFLFHFWNHSSCTFNKMVNPYLIQKYFKKPNIWKYVKYSVFHCKLKLTILYCLYQHQIISFIFLFIVIVDLISMLIYGFVIYHNHFHFYLMLIMIFPICSLSIHLHPYTIQFVSYWVKYFSH